MVARKFDPASIRYAVGATNRALRKGRTLDHECAPDEYFIAMCDDGGCVLFTIAGNESRQYLYLRSEDLAAVLVDMSIRGTVVRD